MRPDPAAGAVHGQLAWRCRRGTKELDLLLLGWLEQHYPLAAPAQQACFAQLLELPDPELAAYLLGKVIPGNPALAALTAQIAGGLRSRYVQILPTRN